MANTHKYAADIRKYSYTANIRKYATDIRKYTTDIRKYTTDIRKYTTGARKFTDGYTQIRGSSRVHMHIRIEIRTHSQRIYNDIQVICRVWVMLCSS